MLTAKDRCTALCALSLFHLMCLLISVALRALCLSENLSLCLVSHVQTQRKVFAQISAQSLGDMSCAHCERSLHSSLRTLSVPSDVSSHLCCSARPLSQRESVALSGVFHPIHPINSSAPSVCVILPYPKNPLQCSAQLPGLDLGDISLGCALLCSAVLCCALLGCAVAHTMRSGPERAIHPATHILCDSTSSRKPHPPPLKAESQLCGTKP